MSNGYNPAGNSYAGVQKPGAWQENPLGSWPPPNASPQPLAQYAGSTVEIVFADPFTAGAPYNDIRFGEIGSNDPADAAYSRRVLWRGFWSSPVFDLRPELRSSSGLGELATPLNRAGSLGQGSRVLAELQRLPLGNYAASYAYSVRDDVGFISGQDLFPVMAPSNINAAVEASPIITSGTTSVMLAFTPPGNPVRFWRCYLVIDILADDTLVPPGPATAGDVARHFMTVWAG